MWYFIEIYRVSDTFETIIFLRIKITEKYDHVILMDVFLSLKMFLKFENFEK